MEYFTANYQGQPFVLFDSVHLVTLLLIALLNLFLLRFRAAPETASILDALPAWPYYIFYIEAIGLLSCLILHLPFALRDRRAKI